MKRKLSVIFVIGLVFSLFFSLSADTLDATPSIETNPIFKKADLPENIQYLVKSTNANESIFLTSDNADDAEAFTLRTENTSTGKGSLTVYSVPIKYTDSTGNRKFIDTSMKALSTYDRIIRGYTYSNASNSFAVEFGKTAAIGINIDDMISMRPNFHSKMKISNPIPAPYTNQSEDGAGKMIYPEAFGEQTLLEYINTESGIKENIILQKNPGVNRFEFIVKTKNQTLELANNNENIFVLDANKKVIYRFLSLYAYDSYSPETSMKSNSSFRHFNEECYYELTDKGNGEYIVTVVVPQDYLNHPEIVYPVTIDPSIILSSTNSNAQDSYVWQSSPNSNYGNLDYIRFGRKDGGDMMGYHRFTNLPSLPAGTAITDAHLKFTFRPGQTSGANGLCFIVTSKQWYETASGSNAGITWNNQPYGNWGYTGVSHNNFQYYNFYVKPFVEGWYSGAYPNYGVDFTYDSTINDYNSVVSSEGAASNAPTLTIAYEPIPNYLPNGVYEILNWNSLKAMDVNGKSQANGSNVHQWSSHWQPSQQWRVTYLNNGYYKIQPMHAPGKCLEVAGGSSERYANVQIYTDNGTNAQQWQIIYVGGGSATFRISPRCSPGKVADVNGAYTTDGANIHMYDWVNGDNQKWAFTTVENYGFKGYAVYRDGAILGVDWHAALMDEPSKNNYKPILHMANSLGPVEWGTWEEFMDKTTNTYKGTYKPAGSVADESKEMVVATGRRLRNEAITYRVVGQLGYDASVYDKYPNRVEPSDITNIRCDGVVEYCYEYNYIRLYGSDANWNIALPKKSNYDEHQLAYITPRKQTEIMTLVGNYEPICN